MDLLLPKRQLGLISPIQVCDEFHFQFYRVSPWDVSLVSKSLDLRAFSERGVEDALATFWESFNFLKARCVDRISMAGIPISAYAGRERVLDLLAEAGGQIDVPVTCD